MNALYYVVSWIINLTWIALIIAILDEGVKTDIEDNQAVAAFLLFVVPTLMEAISFYYAHKPFMFAI